VICEIADVYVICGAGEDMLFTELARVVSDLLCCNRRTDNMSEVKLDWFGKFVKKGRGRMVSIADGGSIVRCS
jgi:hypothetical protein